METIESTPKRREPIKIQDFETDADVQLKVMNIVMHRIGYHPLHRYRDLVVSKRKKFDIELNDFFRHVVEKGIDGRDYLDKTFNELMADEVFTESFQPRDHFHGIAGTIRVEPEQQTIVEEV